MKERANPGGVPVKGARILLDKEISLETAKLLGVPFTYGGCGMALKYIHTPEGPVKLGRVLIDSDHGTVDRAWRKSHAEGLYVDEASQAHVLHLVEFDDEPINWD